MAGIKKQAKENEYDPPPPSAFSSRRARNAFTHSVFVQVRRLDGLEVMEADRADVEHKYEQEVRREGGGGGTCRLVVCHKEMCCCWWYVVMTVGIGWWQRRVIGGVRKLLLNGLLQTKT